MDRKIYYVQREREGEQARAEDIPCHHTNIQAGNKFYSVFTIDYVQLVVVDVVVVCIILCFFCLLRHKFYSFCCRVWVNVVLNSSIGQEIKPTDIQRVCTENAIVWFRIFWLKINWYCIFLVDISTSYMRLNLVLVC